MNPQQTGDLPPTDAGPSENQPAYIAEADCAMHFTDDACCRAVRLNDIVTAYVNSDVSEEIVGCLIERVAERLGVTGCFTFRELLTKSGITTDSACPYSRAIHQSELADERVEILAPRRAEHRAQEPAGSPPRNAVP